jgi:peptidoglycan/LPS O-acetylase OafA/YrhL
VYFGLVSYGVYLWHQAWIGQAFEWQKTTPFQASFPALLTTGLAWTMVTASASWFLLERPLLRRRDGVRRSAA